MAKFSDIRRAEQLIKDKEALDLWSKKSTAEKQAAFKATQQTTGNLRTALKTVEGWITPYGTDQDKIRLAVPIPDSGEPVAGKSETETNLINAFKTLLGARFVVAKPVGANILIVETRGIRGFQPAKAIITENTGTKVEGVKSRFTNRTYSYTKKNSVSCPIGAITGETGLESAATAIKVALANNATLKAKCKIRFTAQKGILVTPAAAS